MGLESAVLAAFEERAQAAAMIWRAITLVLLCALLSGCSYTYDILAVVQNGRLTFIVDPRSGREPDSVSQIEVGTESEIRADAGPGDDLSRVQRGVFWYQDIDHDDMRANRFPVVYGSLLKGAQSGRDIVKAKPLRRETVYYISATSGSTGYGGGSFIIRTDERVENLPYKTYSTDP